MLCLLLNVTTFENLEDQDTANIRLPSHSQTAIISREGTFVVNHVTYIFWNGIMSWQCILSTPHPQNKKYMHLFGHNIGTLEMESGH